MLKRIIHSLVYLGITSSLFAQQYYIDSLVQVAGKTKNDTSKLVLYQNIVRIYAEVNPDSGYHYAEKALQLAQKMGFRLDEENALREIGYAFLNKGNYPRSLQTFLSCLSILEDPKLEKKVLIGTFPGDDELMNHRATATQQRYSNIAFTYQMLGVLYANTNNYEKALINHKLARKNAELADNIPLQSIGNMTMGRVFLNLKQQDSALTVVKQAHKQIIQSGFKRYLGSALLNLGRIYLAMGDKTKAKDYFEQALTASKEYYYYRGVVASNLALADFNKNLGNIDSIFYYVQSGLPTAYYLNAPDLLLRSYTALADYYKMIGRNDSTVKYQSQIIKINDSLFNSKQAQQFQNIDFDEQQRQQQVESARKELQNKWRTGALLAGLAIFSFIALMFWRNSLQRKRANVQLSKQKSELESTLTSLKAAQKQLIQSEKMASLGEMTAGIAHEIQNPLNFVNNFSEVNKELIAELKSKNEKLKIEDDEVNELLNDIEENSEKINHHGKRADAIVKGMLQHSRSSSGQKELTDINTLVDEYLRLAYHGIRVKDKSFDTEIKKDFDNTIGKIKVVPQDIGRALLNLFNNAFYAVKPSTVPNGQKYEPIVWVSTKREGNGIVITVKDNGTGIPQNIVDKIFQPFFTTKPTGQGTGLGLSLAYDIVKSHGGEIEVKTKENEGSEFIVRLPD